MGLPERESRPGRSTGAAQSISTAIKAAGDDSTARADILAAVDDVARHVDGTFVVVVKVTGGKYRRRCFLTAASAQRAADRAVERGETATVFLAELKPLWKLQGGGSR